jgi:hypothetical protein
MSDERKPSGVSPWGKDAEWAERMRVTEYFRARLAEEVRRSERYGRSFAVVFVACADVSPRAVFNNVRPRLRCTDIVEVIRTPNSSGDLAYAEKVAPGPDSEARDEVALILPETDQGGTEIALERLRDYLSGFGDLRIGAALYPRDSTNPNQLLAIAASKAGSRA